MTSNIGADYIIDGIGDDGNISETARENVDTLLKRTFRPEFLNRIDDIVFYKPLTKENIKSIIMLLISEMNERLSDKRIVVEMSEEAKDFVINAAYDPQFGARPLKRYLQSSVETLVARRILEGNILPDSTVNIVVNGDNLDVK